MVKYTLITEKIRTYTRATFFPLYFASCNAKLHTPMKNSNLYLSYSTASHSSLKIKADFFRTSDLNLETLKSDSKLKDTPSNFKESGHPIPNNKATISCFPVDFSFPLVIRATDVKLSAHIDDPYTIDSGQEKESAYSIFRKYMKPISPTLDDVNVENCPPHGSENASGLCKGLNPIPNIKHEESRSIAYEQPDGILSILSYVSDLPVRPEKNPHILCCSPNAVIPPDSNTPKELNKPSEEQLAKVYLELKNQLPSFFVKPLNYKLYSKDIVFENRINGSRTVGFAAYFRQIAFIRIVSHIKFAHVRLEILKITSHPEDSTVRVRWRIVGISSLKSLPMLFSFKAFKLKEKANEDKWIDGFSTFFVSKDGLIYKHIADKVMPDEEIRLAKRPSLASRLASLMGLAPKTPAPTGAAVTSIEDKHRETVRSFAGFGPPPFSLV